MISGQLSYHWSLARVLQLIIRSRGVIMQSAIPRVNWGSNETATSPCGLYNQANNTVKVRR